MKCNYFIQIAGKTYTLASDIEGGQVKDIDDLLKLLRNRDLSALTEIVGSFDLLESVEELDLNNINENSVGLYSSTDLLNSAFTSAVDRNLFNKLKISVAEKNKKNIIAGFGDENVKTQFHNDHIFLNLNYMYDSDNKIIALVEYALYLSDPANYKENSKMLEIDYSSEESKALLATLVNSNKEDDIAKLVSKIQLTYQKVGMKLNKDLAETNLSTSRDNLSVVMSKSTVARVNTNLNYLPKTSIRVENLKQGDLVLIPVTPVDGNVRYTSGVYETFYDSYIDAEGKTIIRTVVQGNANNPETRKRIAQRYENDAKGKTIIKTSSSVEARILDSTLYDGYSYTPGMKYAPIKITMVKGYMGYESLLNILKNPQTKVVINTKHRKTETEKAKVTSESFEISKVQGSTVTLVGGKEIDITKIDGLEYPLVKVDIFPTLPEEGLDADGSIWSRNTHPIIGEHIAFKKAEKDTFLTEGIVIGFGTQDKNKVVYYLTSSGKTSKVNFIAESNVRFTSNPPVKFHISILEQANITSTINDLYKGPDGKIKNITNEMASNKNGTFRNSEYSIQEVNQYTPFAQEDILYDKRTNTAVKVVHSSTDSIKTVMHGPQGPIYFTVQKSDLENFLLLTKRPVNESFAMSNIRKNRYSFSRDQGIKSTEVKIWQNPNGFVYSLPINMTDTAREAHTLYEKGAKDITGQMIDELTTRYKWTTKPTTLFTTYNENTGNLVKDSDNTIRIEMSDALTEKIFQTKEFLQSYIVPGSFITFNNNNAKTFIVEKVYKDRLLVAYYHYTNKANPNVSSSELKTVRAEKFFVDLQSLKNIEVDPTKKNQSKITNLYLPKWAGTAQDMIKSLQDDVTKSYNKKSRLDKFPVSDSPEIVNSMIDLMRNRFGVKITTIHNGDLKQFNDPELYGVSAFVTKEGIFVNLDNASIEEPLHEVLHLILATMKYNNPDTYYRLVNSVQFHPLFKDVYARYTEINSEILEETFIKLLSQTFRHNIIKEGIFNDASFNRAMKGSISEMMNLTEPLDWEDSFDLLGKSMNDILFDFGSSLTDNEESLINEDNINYMFDISQEIKILIDSDKLKQKCSY